MKSIAIDARFILRPLRGMPLYVLMLCRNLPALARHHHFFYLINKGFEHNDTPENYLPRIKEIEKNNPNVTFVNYNDDGEIKWEQVYLPRMIKQYKIDLLHMPGNRVCFFPRTPMVVTIHDIMEFLYLKKSYFTRIAKEKKLRMIFYHTRVILYALTMYKVAIRKPERIITVSAYSADDISTKLNIRRNKISTIYHGLNKEFRCNSIVPLDNRSFTLLLGGDNHPKNSGLAISAWAKVNPGIRLKYPLKVVGFTGNKNSPILQSIRKNGLEDEVKIQGWATEEDMVWYFTRAALFLFPSRYEGFGFPLIQSMASGTPVISTCRSSIPEILGNVGLQYDPDDATGMAKGIERLLTDHNEWKRQSDAGYQRSSLFVWKKSAKQHLALYESVL